MECQQWAERIMPGWDVVAICYLDSLDCIRGEGAGALEPVDAAGVDAGSSYRNIGACGDGPACGPGFMCARPLGDPTAPRACVCDHP